MHVCAHLYLSTVRGIVFFGNLGARSCMEPRARQYSSWVVWGCVGGQGADVRGGPTRAEARGPRKAGKELGLFFFFQPVLWEINVVGSQAAVRRGGMAEPEAGGERHPCPLVEVRAPILNEWEKFIEVLQSKCMIMTPGHATVFCTLRNPPSGQRGQL